MCGAAAILSVASMAKEREPHAGVAIALITLAGTVALLLYPSVYRRLHPDAGRTRLRHGGESEIVRKRFFELDETEQKVIYAFISAL